MKKLILSLSILLSIGVKAQTPTLTQSNHAPIDGFTYESINCDTANTSYLPGNSGNGVLWMFPVVTTTASNTFTTSVCNNTLYAPANYSIAASGGNNSYYQSKTDSLNLIVAIADINGLSVTLKYTTPAVLAKYSMNYSDNINTNTAGTINGGFGTFSGNCDVTYDGVGSMQLPLRTFANVSRLKTVQTYTYSSPIFSGDLKTVTYDYYVIGLSRVPILSVSTTTLNHTDNMNSSNNVVNGMEKFVTVLKGYQDVKVPELTKNKIEVSSFPNPATNYITFSTNSKEAAKVIVMDITGKTVTTETFEVGKAKLNVSNLSTGMYLYNVLNKNNEVLARDKFNVTK